MGSIQGTPRVAHGYGASGTADGLTPARAQMLGDQALTGTPSAQAAAKAELKPHLENSMEQYMKSHPGATPQDFLAALDRGAVSASDMGLYGRGTEAEAVAAGKKLGQVLHADPAYAAQLGIQ